MTTATVEPLWTIEEVAAYLRVPLETLYQWRRPWLAEQEAPGARR